MLPRTRFRSNIAGASARYRQGTHSSVRSSHPRLCSMKPSDTGPASPQPSLLRSGREAAPSQLDLFAERGRVTLRHVPKPMASSAVEVETLTADELLELVPKAGPSNVEALCSRLVALSLEAAVPALEALWQRFTGFGIEKPLREQLAVVDTLARLGGTDAPSALRRIVLSKALPASLLPAALQAAAQAGLALPARFVGPVRRPAPRPRRRRATRSCLRPRGPGGRFRRSSSRGPLRPLGREPPRCCGCARTARRRQGPAAALRRTRAISVDGSHRGDHGGLGR